MLLPWFVENGSQAILFAQFAEIINLKDWMQMFGQTGCRRFVQIAERGVPLEDAGRAVEHEIVLM